MFLVIVLLNFSISRIVFMEFKIFDLLNFLILSLISVFIISNFIVNFEGNFNEFALLNIFSYIINVVLFFVIFPRSLRLQKAKFEFFTNAILVIAVIMSFISLIYYSLGIHYISLYSFTSAGLFGHPNTTSMFYTICIPVLMYKYFSKKISFVVFVSLLIFFLIVVLFTFSRAGYIGVGIGILIYTFYKSRILFVLVSILVLFIAYTIVLDFATAKVDSSLTRMLLIMAAISIITQSRTTLLWGYGPVNALNTFMNEKVFYGDEPVPNPHNLFLLLTMQFGLIFTIIATLIVVTLIVKGIILKFRNSNFANDQGLNLSMTILISLTIQNLFEDVVVNPKYFFMPVFLIFAGYIFYSLKYKDVLSPDDKVLSGDSGNAKIV